eukprot:6200908-Pleurochrysis_carterae.AAC.2
MLGRLAGRPLTINSYLFQREWERRRCHPRGALRATTATTGRRVGATKGRPEDPHGRSHVALLDTRLAQPRLLGTHQAVIRGSRPLRARPMPRG